MSRLRLILSILLAYCLPGGALAAEFDCRENFSPPAVHKGATLKVATLNIAHGRGTSLNQMLIGRELIEQNLDIAARQITETGAQVVALQELDVDSRWAGRFDHAEHLLQASHLECATLGLHAETWLYRFGTGLLSTVELTEPLATAFEPTPPTTNKGFIAATLYWSTAAKTRPVRVSSVHLDFSRKGARQRQMGKIIDAAQRATVPPCR
jgi:endonuclease/exonuclease/phosphatase family metal-dependent hydrolase